MSTFTRIGLSLIALIVAFFYFFGPAQPDAATSHPTTRVAALTDEPRSVDTAAPNPVRILSVQGGSRFIEVYGVVDKGLFTFHPFIERDDTAVLTVLRTVIQQQTGEPVAEQQYLNEENPRRIVMGAPGNQYGVLLFKDSASGEVYMAHIKRQ